MAGTTDTKYMHRIRFMGAMGTIVGFVCEGAGPTDFSALELSQRKIPIVLVQNEAFPYSCSNAIPRLVPIVPFVGPAVQGFHRAQLPLLMRVQPIVCKE